MPAIAYVMDFRDYVKLTEGGERYYCIRTKEMGREVALHLICTSKKNGNIYVYEELAIVEHPREYSERVKYFRDKVKKEMPDAIVGFITFNVQVLTEVLGFGESVASFASVEEAAEEKYLTYRGR